MKNTRQELEKNNDHLLSELYYLSDGNAAQRKETILWNSPLCQ